MINQVCTFSIMHKDTQERHLFVSYGEFKSSEEFWEKFGSRAEVEEYDKRTLRWHEDITPNGNSGIFEVEMPEEFA